MMLRSFSVPAIEKHIEDMTSSSSISSDDDEQDEEDEEIVEDFEEIQVDLASLNRRASQPLLGAPARNISTPMAKASRLSRKASMPSTSSCSVLQLSRLQDVLSPEDWLRQKPHKKAAATVGAASPTQGSAVNLVRQQSNLLQQQRQQDKQNPITAQQNEAQKQTAPSGYEYDHKMQEIEAVIRRRQEVLADLKNQTNLFTLNEAERAEQRFASLDTIFEQVLPLPLGVQLDAPGIGSSCFDVDHAAELEFIEKHFLLGQDGTETTYEEYCVIDDSGSPSSTKKCRRKVRRSSVRLPPSQLSTVSTVSPQLPQFTRAIKLYIYYLIESKRRKDALKAIDIALRRNPVSCYCFFERVEVFKFIWLSVRNGNLDSNNELMKGFLSSGDALDRMYTETRTAMKCARNARDMAKAYRNAAFYHIEGGHFDAALACCLASLRYESANLSVTNILFFVVQRIQEQHNTYLNKQNERAKRRGNTQSRSSPTPSQYSSPQKRTTCENSQQDQDEDEALNFLSFRISLPDITVYSNQFDGERSSQDYQRRCSTSCNVLDERRTGQNNSSQLPSALTMPQFVMNGVIDFIQEYLNLREEQQKQRATIGRTAFEEKQQSHSTPTTPSGVAPRTFNHIQQQTTRSRRGSFGKSLSLPRLFNSGHAVGRNSPTSASSDTQLMPTNDISLLARVTQMLQRPSTSSTPQEHTELGLWVNETLERFGLPVDYHPLWAVCYESAAIKFEQQGKVNEAVECYSALLGMTSQQANAALSRDPNATILQNNMICSRWPLKKRQ